MARKTPEPVAHPAIGPQPLDPRRHAFIFPDYPSWRNRPGCIPDLIEVVVYSADGDVLDTIQSGDSLWYDVDYGHFYWSAEADEIEYNTPDDRGTGKLVAHLYAQGNLFQPAASSNELPIVLNDN